MCSSGRLWHDDDDFLKSQCIDIISIYHKGALFRDDARMCYKLTGFSSVQAFCTHIRATQTFCLVVSR